ncbi:uncharacterized protein LOC134343448 isoform X2 [Mobula hypostoma]
MVAEVLLESVIYTCTQTGVLYNGEFLLQEHTDWPFFKELTEGCAVVGCGLWQPLWMIQFLAGVTKNLECHEDRNFGTTVVAVRDLCTQGSFEDPDLELHAGFGSLWKWDPFSGFHDWLLFNMPRVWPENLDRVRKPKILGLWRWTDRGSVTWLETWVSSGRPENLSPWAQRPEVFVIFGHRAWGERECWMKC